MQLEIKPITNFVGMESQCFSKSPAVMEALGLSRMGGGTFGLGGDMSSCRVCMNECM